MRELNRKVLATVFFFHLGALIVFLFYTMLSDMKTLLPELSLQWTFGKALGIWLQYLVPITLAAIVIAYSLVISTQDLRSKSLSGSGFVAVAGSSVRLFLVFAVLYVLIVAFIQGPIQTLYIVPESKSERVTEYKNIAAASLEKGDYEAAKKAYTLALKISPENADLNKLKNDLLARTVSREGAEAQNPQVLDSQGSAGSEPVSDQKTFAFRDLILRVEDYLGKEDYFSALYYLELAKKLGPSRDNEIILLETRAKSGIRGEALSEADAQKKRIYQLKQEAILELKETGRAEIAYFLLLEVDRLTRNPNGNLAGTVKLLPGQEYVDPDVRKWMPLVLDDLKGQAFFKKEWLERLNEISNNSLVFVNSENSDSGEKEIFYSKAVVPAKFSYFLLEPEIITVNAQGVLTSHRKASVGKLVPLPQNGEPLTPKGKQVLLMRSIDDENQNQAEEATVLTGTIDGNAKNIAVINFDAETLWNIAAKQQDTAAMTIPELLNVIPQVNSLGFDIRPYHEILLMHGTKVISYVSLLLFALGIAWSNRSRYFNRPAFLSLIMIVLIPVVTSLLYALYLHVAGLINGKFLDIFGFETALVAMIVLQALQLILSLIYVATRPSH